VWESRGLVVQAALIIDVYCDPDGRRDVKS
jgi:hypothetical protein